MWKQKLKIPLLTDMSRVKQFPCKSVGGNVTKMVAKILVKSNRKEASDWGTLLGPLVQISNTKKQISPLQKWPTVSRKKKNDTYIITL